MIDGWFCGKEDERGKTRHNPLGGWGGSSKNELLGGVKIFYFCLFSLLLQSGFTPSGAKL